MEWQDIATAPKDGHARLVWRPDNRCIYCVSWIEYSDGWGVFGGYGWAVIDGVTHWMPLPAPPGEPT